MLLKLLRQFILPDLLDMPVKLLLQFLLLYLVTKQEFAVISLGMLFFSYHPLGQLGTLDFLMLKLPENYINNDNLDSNKNLNLSRQLVLLVTFFSGFIVIITCFITNQSNFIIFAFFAFIVQSLLYQKYLYRTVLLRYSYNLKYLSKIKVSLSLSRLVLSTIGLYFFGAYGYLTAEAIIYLLPLLIFKKFKIKEFSNSISEILSLVKLSLPFLLLSLINLVSSQIDRWIIISNSTLEVFADYTLCVIIITSVLIVPGKVNSLIMQYFREFYVSKKSEKDYYVRVIAYLQFSIIFFGLFAIISIELVNYMISSYLSKYLTVLKYLPIIILILPVKYIFSIISALIGLEFKQKYISFFKVIFVIIFLISIFLIKVNLEGILNIVLGSTILLIILMGTYLFRNHLKEFKLNLLMLMIMFFLVLFISYNFNTVLSKTISFLILILLTQYKYFDFFKFLSNKLFLK